MSVNISAAQLLRLANAKTIEGKLSTTEFSFSSDQIETIKDFASRLSGSSVEEAMDPIKPIDPYELVLIPDDGIRLLSAAPLKRDRVATAGRQLHARGLRFRERFDERRQKADGRVELAVALFDGQRSVPRILVCPT